jgi:hypothetical protein
MAQMATQLHKKLESWRDDETWKSSNLEAMDCYDLQDTVQYGLFLIRAIEHHEARWKNDIRTGTIKFNPENAREIVDFYEWWYEPVPLVMDWIRRVEEAGYRVDGANDFRAKVESFHKTQFDPGRVEKSLKQFGEGKGRPLQELRDAVQRRHVV